jgi:hypothetical protein
LLYIKMQINRIDTLIYEVNLNYNTSCETK